MNASPYKLFQLTFNDYVRQYPEDLSKFLNDYEDNTEEYFIIEQRAIMQNSLNQFGLIIKGMQENEEASEEFLDLFRNRVNTTKKIDNFLEQRSLEVRGFQHASNGLGDDNYQESTTIPNKIMLLDQLGVIDFLKNRKPFATSPNLLAKALSYLLEEKQVSIYPVLSTLLKKDESSPKHPYYIEKNRDTVENWLSKCGYVPQPK